MNDIHIYNSRLLPSIILMTALLGAAWAAWLGEHMLPLFYSRLILLGCILLTLYFLIKLLFRRPKIIITVQGIQFFYPTQRIDKQSHMTLQNQFIAWEDIQSSQLKGRILQLQIDDNPPDYERLTDIELANLPPREMVLYQLNAAIGGFNISPKKITHWLTQMQYAQPKERTALILSFHYAK